MEGLESQESDYYQYDWLFDFDSVGLTEVEEGMNHSHMVAAGDGVLGLAVGSSVGMIDLDEWIGFGESAVSACYLVASSRSPRSGRNQDSYNPLHRKVVFSLQRH